jgi:hypothetical protein
MVLSANVELYIQALKSHFGVRTDEELAGKVGLSKQAIANWRSRGRVPLRFQQRMLDEQGIRYSDWDYQFESPDGDIIYAVAFYAAQKLLGDQTSPDRLRTVGQVFPQIVKAVTKRLKGISTQEGSAESVIELLTTYVDSGRFEEIEQLRDDITDE